VRRVTPKRLLNISLILVFALLIVPLYVDKGLNDSMDHADGSGTVGGVDFKAYYIAADMLRKGRDFYDVELQTEEVLARGLPLNPSFYIYPPLLAMCFVPLTVLPIQTAAQLWFLVNLVLYGFSLFLIIQALELGRVTNLLPLLWIAAFLFPPALFTLHKGQANIVILLLLAISYWLYRRRLEAAAGVALGFAVMIKIVPICLLLYFLWKRKYRLTLASIGTVLIISILGLLIVGIGPHQTYITSVLPSLAEPRPSPGNQSLGGFLSLLFIENNLSLNLTDNPTAWKALTLVSSSLFVLAVVFLCWHNKQKVIGMELEFALVVTTLPLIANIAWVDFFVIAVISYAVLFKFWSDRGFGSYLVVPTIASLVLISSPRFLDAFTNQAVKYHSWLYNPFAIALPLYGLIALWVTLAITLRQTSREEMNDVSSA
jgi:hypothetical protein